MANIRPLSDDLQEKAIEELNEDVSRIHQDIEAIKNWLKQQKYIKARTDDQTILTFLRGCKFSLERTKEKIDTFYTMHTLVIEFLRNRDPFQDDIQEILELGLLLPMRNQKDPRGPRVILVNLAAFDPVKINKENIMKTFIMIIDILLNEDDQMIISGMQLLVVFDGMKMANVMSVSLMLKALKYLQDAVPSRVKGLHLLKMPKFFEAAYYLLRSLLSKKLQERVLVYNTTNYDDVYKIVDKEDMPKTHGGNGPTMQELTDYWKKKVESYAEWFKAGENYGTDEKLRPGKPKTSQDYFGIEGVDGSFRKLNVD